MPQDASRGYEAVAHEFMAARSQSGLHVVRRWAASLPRGGSVVDVGAGHGEPFASVLMGEGLNVWAIDASPTMVAAFERGFPGARVACEPAERSGFFGRTFDAALVIGLVFLLPEDGQRELVRRLSAALSPGGRLLLSAPREEARWRDVLTGRTSTSLGAERYERLLAEADLRIDESHTDEGGNHYYEASKGRG